MLQRLSPALQPPAASCSPAVSWSTRQPFNLFNVLRMRLWGAYNNPFCRGTALWQSYGPNIAIISIYCSPIVSFKLIGSWLWSIILIFMIFYCVCLCLSSKFASSLVFGGSILWKSWILWGFQVKISSFFVENLVSKVKFYPNFFFFFKFR